MDLSEVLGVEEIAEQLAHSRLEAHEGLVGGDSQVDDAVVETHILTDIGSLLLFTCTSLDLGLIEVLFLFLIFNSLSSIFNLEGEHGCCLVDSPDLLNMELDLLGGTANWLLGDCDECLHLDDGFLRDGSSVLDHTFRDLR